MRRLVIENDVSSIELTQKTDTDERWTPIFHDFVKSLTAMGYQVGILQKLDELIYDEEDDEYVISSELIKYLNNFSISDEEEK